MARGSWFSATLRAGVATAVIAIASGVQLTNEGELGFASALAQTGSGSVSGDVTDEATGVALAGARITIVELDRRVSADRDGRFSIDGVPAGTYTIRVDYLGLPSLTQSLTVAAGSESSVTFAFDSQGSDDIVVTGRVDEVTRRLNQERAAPALTEVAASSTSAEFPDRNLGEVLQRLTGVFIDRNGTGEGNVLLIRGINSNNNLLLVEGMRLPSGRADGRTPNLATINSDTIESVEVRKVFTPEIPADFFGGYSNVRQISAFDRNGDFLVGGLETGRRSISTQGWDVEATLRGSTRLANDTIGIAFAAGYDRRDSTFEQFNIIRSPNNLGGALVAPATFPQGYQYRQSGGTIERRSVNAAIEFRPNDDLSFYFRAFWNYGKERQTDQRLNVLFRGSPSAGSTATAGSYLSIIPELEAITTLRPERFQNYVVGGDNRFGGWTLNYSLGYNELIARQDDAVRYGARGATSLNTVTYDSSSPENPLFALANASLLTIPATYGAVVSPSTNLAYTREEQYIGQLNVANNFTLGGNEVELRFGGRFDQRDRRSDVGGVQAFANIANASSFITNGSGSIFRDRFSLPLQLDTSALSGSFPLPSPSRPAGDPNYLTSIAGDFSGRERIYAGYGMATFDTGPLRIIGGVRYEETKTSGTNFSINRALNIPVNSANGVTSQAISASYSAWLPALVLRLEPNENMLVRFAATRTYARPTIAQLLQAEVISPNAGTQNRTISRGNADLQPQTAWNFDASIDLYGSRGSVLRFGLFYKSLDRVFYTASTTAANAAGGTDFITQPQNGGSGSAMGMEIGMVQPLSFLPGPLSRLSVELNGGLAWTDQNVLNAAGVVIRSTDLEQSYRFIGNASLVYRDDWGVARIAYRRASTRLNAIDVNPDGGFNDGFRAPAESLDADISFRLTDHISVFAEARNVLNQIEVVEYLGSDPRATTRGQYSGRSFGLGVRLTLAGGR